MANPIFSNATLFNNSDSAPEEYLNHYLYASPIMPLVRYYAPPAKTICDNNWVKCGPKATTFNDVSVDTSKTLFWEEWFDQQGIKHRDSIPESINTVGGIPINNLFTHAGTPINEIPCGDLGTDCPDHQNWPGKLAQTVVTGQPLSPSSNWNNSYGGMDGMGACIIGQPPPGDDMGKIWDKFTNNWDNKIGLTIKDWSGSDAISIACQGAVLYNNKPEDSCPNNGGLDDMKYVWDTYTPDKSSTTVLSTPPNPMFFGCSYPSIRDNLNFTYYDNKGVFNIQNDIVILATIAKDPKLQDLNLFKRLLLRYMITACAVWWNNSIYNNNDNAYSSFSQTNLDITNTHLSGSSLYDTSLAFLVSDGLQGELTQLFNDVFKTTDNYSFERVCDQIFTCFIFPYFSIDNNNKYTCTLPLYNIFDYSGKLNLNPNLTALDLANYFYNATRSPTTYKDPLSDDGTADVTMNDKTLSTLESPRTMLNNGDTVCAYDTQDYTIPPLCAQQTVLNIPSPYSRAANMGQVTGGIPAIGLYEPGDLRDNNGVINNINDYIIVQLNINAISDNKGEPFFQLITDPKDINENLEQYVIGRKYTGKVNSFSRNMYLIAKAQGIFKDTDTSYCGELNEGSVSKATIPSTGSNPINFILTGCFNKYCSSESSLSSANKSFCANLMQQCNTLNSNPIPKCFLLQDNDANNLFLNSNGNSATCDCYRTQVKPVTDPSITNPLFDGQCFTKLCTSSGEGTNNPDFKDILGLGDNQCTGACPTVAKWIQEGVANENDIDVSRFNTLCGETKVKPSSAKRASVWIIAVLIYVSISALIYYTQYKKGTPLRKIFTTILITSLVLIPILTFLCLDLQGSASCANGIGGGVLPVCKSKYTNITVPRYFCDIPFKCECVVGEPTQSCPSSDYLCVKGICVEPMYNMNKIQTIDSANMINTILPSSGDVITSGNRLSNSILDMIYFNASTILIEKIKNNYNINLYDNNDFSKATNLNSTPDQITNIALNNDDPSTGLVVYYLTYDPNTTMFSIHDAADVTLLEKNITKPTNMVYKSNIVFINGASGVVSFYNVKLKTIVLSAPMCTNCTTTWMDVDTKFNMYFAAPSQNSVLMYNNKTKDTTTISNENFNLPTWVFVRESSLQRDDTGAFMLLFVINDIDGRKSNAKPVINIFKIYRDLDNKVVFFKGVPVNLDMTNQNRVFLSLPSTEQ